MPNPTDKDELRKQVEDLIVDTTLHPVDASLRIMQLFDRYADRRIKKVIISLPLDVHERHATHTNMCISMRAINGLLATLKESKDE